MARLFHKIVSLLLGTVLGPAACTESADEYGMPHATYKLDGQVVKAASDPVEGIPGIEVDFGGTKVLSDSNGHWSMTTVSFPVRGTARVAATDIDGPTNGSWKATNAGFEPVKTVDGSGWNEGTFEKSGIVIAMEEDGTE